MINNLEKEDSETVNKEDKNMSLDMFWDDEELRRFF
jgi:hypothetical protein